MLRENVTEGSRKGGETPMGVSILWNSIHRTGVQSAEKQVQLLPTISLVIVICKAGLFIIYIFIPIFIH